MSDSESSSLLLEEIFRIFVSLVGGGRYGVKIRLPHAAVMTTLFRREWSTRRKLLAIVRATVEHAANLAAFATVYKSILACLKHASRSLTAANQTDAQSPPGHPEHSYHALIAGAVGGYCVWGRYTAVNHQIVLYLTSRVLVGLWKRWTSSRTSRIGGGDAAVQGQQGVLSVSSTSLLRRENDSNSNKLYGMSAAIVWGLVMFLFEDSPDVLHPSLRKSMMEIYRYREDNHDDDN